MMCDKVHISYLIIKLMTTTNKATTNINEFTVQIVSCFEDTDLDELINAC